MQPHHPLSISLLLLLAFVAVPNSPILQGLVPNDSVDQARVRLRLLDAEHDAVRGLEVRVVSIRHISDGVCSWTLADDTFTTSDAHGVIEVTLGGGESIGFVRRNKFIIVVAGFSPAEVHFRALCGGERHDLGDVVLIEGGRVAGRVVDRSGRPLGSAEVRYEAKELQIVTFTGGDGRYEFDNLPHGTLQIDAPHPLDGAFGWGDSGLPAGSTRVTTVVGECVEADVLTTRSCVQVGRVVGAQGQPVVGCEVSSESSNVECESPSRPDTTCTTDARGFFVVRRSGRELAVVRDGIRYRFEDEGEEFANVLTLPSLQRWRAKVRGSDDQPLAATVILGERGSFSSQTGEFDLLLPEDIDDLWIEAPGYREERVLSAVQPSTSPTEITLRPKFGKRDLEWQFVDSRGIGIEGVRVFGYDHDYSEIVVGVSGVDGVVAVPSAGFIDCRWEAAGWMTPREDSSDDGPSRNTTRAWEGMDPPRLRKQLVRSAFLEVVVTEADGQPYSHAELHVLRKEGGVVLPFRRSATGVTAFRLQPGVTYQVSSFDDKTGYSSPVREITPRAGECDRWNVSLPPVSRRHVRCSYEGVLLKNTYLWASSPETLLGRPIWVDSEGIATLEFRDGTGTIRLGHATRAWLLCLVPDGPRCVGTVDVSRAPIHPGVVETCIFAPE